MSIDKKSNLCYSIRLKNEGIPDGYPFKLTKNMKFTLNAGILLLLLMSMVTFGSVEVKADQNPVSNDLWLIENSPTVGTTTIMTGVDLNLAHGILRSGTPDKKIKAVITAYTSTPDQTDSDPFTAASGKRVYDGMIAANGLPFGTKIKIPSLYGDKVFTVDDRMNSRYGFGRMDIWFDSSKGEAMKFGVKRVEVEIYYPAIRLASQF